MRTGKKKQRQSTKKETYYILADEIGCFDAKIYESVMEIEEDFDAGSIDEGSIICEMTVTKTFRVDRKLELVEE